MDSKPVTKHSVAQSSGYVAMVRQECGRELGKAWGYTTRAPDGHGAFGVSMNPPPGWMVK